jgi:hypothetical protein
MVFTLLFAVALLAARYRNTEAELLLPINGSADERPFELPASKRQA